MITHNKILIMSRREPHPAPLCRHHPILPQLNGVFVLNKPTGPTSAQCLGLFKRLGQKKIGHAGTLDPLATGVLIVLLGQATKLSQWLLESGGKTYSGIIRLGIETDTWDILGKVLCESSPAHISTSQLASGIEAWQGMREQEIPAYSAAKHNGQPLYKLARKGKDMPRKVRTIEVSRAELLHVALPFVHFRVSCGSGSYVRSLAHRLGKRLGCGAALFRLTREYSHPFGLDEACTLPDLRHDPELLARRLRPLGDALPGWTRIQVDARGASDARNGRPVRHDPGAPANGNAILYDGDAPLALARLSETGDSWTIIRGLWN